MLDPIDLAVHHNLKCVVCEMFGKKVPADYLVPRNELYKVNLENNEFEHHTDMSAVCQRHLEDWYETRDEAHDDIQPIHLIQPEVADKDLRKCTKDDLKRMLLATPDLQKIMQFMIDNPERQNASEIAEGAKLSVDLVKEILARVDVVSKVQGFENPLITTTGRALKDL